MFKTSLLSLTLLATPVADTVWWRTTGGTVIQHANGDRETCTLTLEDNQTQFAFVWHQGLPPSIMVAQTTWNLTPDTTTTVAMRIGDAWLGNGNGAPNLTAMTGRSSLMIIPEQPVDGLLSSADVVEVRTRVSQAGVQLAPTKMTALLAALRQCRASTGTG